MSKSSQDANTNFIERQKSRWVPDALSTNCARCGAQWTVFRRKHHCRRCYQVFCDPCCSNKVTLPGYGVEPQRVCKICEAILAGSTASTSIEADGKPIATASGGSHSVGTAAGSLSSQQQIVSSASRGRSAGSALDGTAPGGGKPMPSLECFPRERRVLLVGSAGVGKGSFVATACGSSSSPYTTGAAAAPGAGQQLQQLPQSQPLSPESGGAAAARDASPAALGGAGGGSGGNAAAAGSSAPTERRRLIPYQGQLYSLTLVNTAGSTVSSDLFVHPLLTIGTSAYVLMYDVTEPKSFELLPLLYERLLDCGAGDKAVLLVGSKADHVSQTGAGRDRVVSKDAALRQAKQWGAPHVDCACTSKDSVDNALLELIKEISSRDTF